MFLNLTYNEMNEKHISKKLSATNGTMALKNDNVKNNMWHKNVLYSFHFFFFETLIKKFVFKKKKIKKKICT